MFPDLTRDSLAYLQYTSGSTGVPKGVMVSHGNLLHNVGFLSGDRGHTGIVSWLPLFHDMGLIYALLQAFYASIPCVILPPAAFLQRPLRWLEALSKFQYSTAIAPNFAYELCVDKIGEEEKAGLDLSRWTMALNAAEPVRLRTLERFSHAFAPCGFRAEFLKPAYGLAEATLGVSISTGPGRYKVRFLEKQALTRNQVIERDEGSEDTVIAVGCGKGGLDQEVAIVDPESLLRCHNSEVGEIWISSPSVALGYWNKPNETAEVFRARISGSGEGPFLRTGDLGFVCDGELFIVGRVKDLIIVRGANHYPQDIERSIQESHTGLQQDAGAAFSIETEGSERLVVVQEITRHSKADCADVIRIVRESVSEVHGISINSLLLVKPHSVPKTSSGKIQRRLARQMFLEGRFDVLAEWHDPGRCEVVGSEAEEPFTHRSSPPVSDHTIRNLVLERLASTLRVPKELLDVRAPFSRLGLDSLGAASLSGELEVALNRKLAASLLYDYPTVEELARHLSVEMGSRRNRVLPVGTPLREDIAVIGFGCRFAGVDDPHGFWELLHDGVDAISVVPPERWDWEAYFHPEPGVRGKMNTKWGGFLRNVDLFAADFFEISRREAVQMDPQQRLLLEVSWEALENSGIPASRIAGSRTGVYIGVSGFDYWLKQLREHSAIDAYAGTGLAHSIAANRISYCFDLRGPSVVVDTACSSSLVAIHQACESLRRGETDLVLSGGVNLLLSPEMSIALSHARLMASDGRCKTFDSRADGYVRGEGCAVVVLKRFSDAQRDGDSILALIHGSAVNQDGKSNGLTAPNGPAQEEVIREALRQAGVLPGEISYVECHGTGTVLGDPQELDALQRVLTEGRDRSAKCWIGSVKTNIGHLEPAAGIAGLLKVVLALKNRRIPPHLHLKKLNPHIRLNSDAFEIPTKVVDWRCQGRRLAGVSSFGFGGTNCHVVLGEAPERIEVARVEDGPLHLLTISAKTADELKAIAGAIASHLASPRKESFRDLCFTSNVGRQHFAHRLAVVAASSEEAAEWIGRFLRGDQTQSVVEGTVGRGGPKKVAFLFPGLGSQFLGMGRELFDSQPLFRKIVQECDEVLRSILERSIVSMLYSETGEVSEIDDTLNAQPALFAVSYALSMLWKSWGIVPGAVLGHGIGEYVAACVSAVFDLESGLRLVAMHARLSGALPRTGGMAMVSAPMDTVSEAINLSSGALSIAAINGPNHTVISGETGELRRAVEALRVKNFQCQMLKGSPAFHSRLMEPILDEFERFCGTITFKAPHVPIVSNLTGDWYSPDFIPDASYWRRQMRKPVHFSDGLSRLIDAGHTVFVECGPGQALSDMGERCQAKSSAARPSQVLWLNPLRSGECSLSGMLGAASRLYANGFDLNWPELDPGSPKRKVALPTYQFKRERFWIDDLTPPAGVAVDRPQSSDRKSGTFDSREKIWDQEAQKFEGLNELSLQYFARMLRDLVAFPSEKNNWTLSEIADRAQLHDLSRSLLNVGLGQLTEAGYLFEREGRFSAGREVSENSLETAKTNAKDLWSGESQLMELVVRCGEHLTAVLAGKEDPLPLLFPNGDARQVEWIYRDSRIAQCCNSAVRNAVQEFRDRTDRKRPIRLLEIGGGTGATTSSVLTLLDERSANYTFTDVGTTFVERARHGLSRFPFVDFRILDIETSPVSQGFERNVYDIVIAANVVHATRRLKKTFEHIQELLNPGGVLILWETTKLQPWLSITFGLLNGWRRFEDFDLRPTNPLLSPDQWLRFFASNNLRSLQVYPLSKEQRDIFGQSVFVAQTEGLSARGVTKWPERDSPASILSGTRDETGLAYEVQWIQKPSVAEGAERIGANSGNWLFLCDKTGCGEALADALERRGQKPFLVFEGVDFQRTGSRSCQISPQDATQFKSLVNDWILGNEGKPFSGIVHFWGLNCKFAEIQSSLDLRRSQISGCATILRLVREMSANAESGRSLGKLWIVTRAAQATGLESRSLVDVSQGALWGFGRTLALEHSSNWGGLIDLDPENANTSNETEILLNALIADTPNDELVVRSGGCYVPRLRPIQIAKAGRIPLTPDAAYLITGGLGGIGLTLAPWLIEHGARRLILAGRTKLPPRTSWKRLIAAGEHPLCAKLQALTSLERLGAAVEYVSLDVSVDADVSAFLRKYEKQAFPPIRGVFHAAGGNEDRFVLDMDESEFFRVFDAKALGGWILARHLAKRQVEFFVFFSSAAAIFGSRGGANYAAANSFLDLLAPYLSSRQTRALSVGWGPWTGTGLADAARQDKLRRQGIESISPALALDLLGRLFQQQAAHAMVADVSWPQFLTNEGRQRREMLSEIAEHAGLGDCDRAIIGEKVGKSNLWHRRSEVETKLIELVAELLQTKPSQIDSGRKLHSLGLDSIMAVQLKHELELQFGFETSIQNLIQVSVEDLASVLESKSE